VSQRLRQRIPTGADTAGGFTTSVRSTITDLSLQRILGLSSELVYGRKDSATSCTTDYNLPQWEAITSDQQLFNVIVEYYSTGKTMSVWVTAKAIL
jgi:hypothetical protein